MKKIIIILIVAAIAIMLFYGMADTAEVYSNTETILSAENVQIGITRGAWTGYPADFTFTSGEDIQLSGTIQTNADAGASITSMTLTINRAYLIIHSPALTTAEYDLAPSIMVVELDQIITSTWTASLGDAPLVTTSTPYVADLYVNYRWVGLQIGLIPFSETDTENINIGHFGGYIVPAVTVPPEDTQKITVNTGASDVTCSLTSGDYFQIQTGATCTFSDVPVGVYIMEASRPGFISQSASGNLVAGADRVITLESWVAGDSGDDGDEGGDDGGDDGSDDGDDAIIPGWEWTTYGYVCMAVGLIFAAVAFGVVPAPFNIRIFMAAAIAIISFIAAYMFNTGMI